MNYIDLLIPVRAYFYNFVVHSCLYLIDMTLIKIIIHTYKIVATVLVQVILYFNIHVIYIK